jgi:hypothetical protein
MAGTGPNTQAIHAAIQHAATTSMPAALTMFGGQLSDTEKAVLGSLSQQEVGALASANAKLGSLGAKMMDNNNL